MDTQTQTMRCIEVGADKTPESLTLATRPCPQPGADDILVAVAAAGVNRGDCVQRMGFYPPPPGASDVMGLEFAGTVLACGQNVRKWQVGDRVAALTAGGAYATHACVHADHALPVPANMTLTDAAALPEVLFTVWANVFEAGGLAADETLLVHGGSSGIGTAAIQMGKMRGARVLVTAGSDEKCAACCDLGADRAINYRQENFVDAVMADTAGRGADVILDMVGGDYLDKNIACAARHGRIVNIAYMSGSRIEADFLPVMLKNLTLTGSTLRARPTEEKTRLAGCVAAEIWPHIGGAIKPIIHAVLPLSEAGTAQTLMESSAHIGKIILDCRA